MTIIAMSALPPIADMCGATRDVRFVPIADIHRARVKKETASITSFIRRQPSVSFATPVDPMRRGRWRRVAVIDVGSGNTSGREDAYR